MAMTVKDLRQFLEGRPDEWLVVLAGDVEESGYVPLSAARDVLYQADTVNRDGVRDGAGDIYDPPEFLATARASGAVWPDYEERRTPADVCRAVVLNHL